MKMLNFIPKQINGKDVVVKESKQRVAVKMGGTGTPKEIVLNNELRITSDLFEIVGLYFGDGLNTRRHTGNRRTAFANSNFELHKKWLHFLESLGITKDELFAQISIGKNRSKKLAFEYWSTKTHIPKERFAKVSNSKEKSRKEGVLSIEFNSILFRKIFDTIFDYCLDVLSKRNEFIPPFIAGLFAAEGRVAANSHSLSYLGIAIKDLDRRRFVKSLLSRIGIRPASDNKKSCEIIISGYVNFKIFNDLNMFSTHPVKRDKFRELFEHLSTSKVPALTKIKVIDLLKSKNFSIAEISKILNKDYSIIHKTVRDLEIKGLVVRTKEGSSRYICYLVNVPENNFILMKSDY